MSFLPRLHCAHPGGAETLFVIGVLHEKTHLSIRFRSRDWDDVRFRTADFRHEYQTAHSCRDCGHRTRPSLERGDLAGWALHAGYGASGTTAHYPKWRAGGKTGLGSAGAAKAGER